MLRAFYLYIGLLLIALCVSCATTAPVLYPQSKPVVESYRVVESATVRIAAVGDIMLGGKATPFLARRGYDFPFGDTRHLLKAADIAIGNLETALTTRGEPPVDKEYLFRNPPDITARALRGAGIDVLSLANNHSMDYGVTGLQDTMAALERVGIHHHGAAMDEESARRAVRFKLLNGQTIGCLAYSNTFPKEFWADVDKPGAAFGHEQHVHEDVSLLVKQGVDVVVVSFHWGRERESELRPYQPLLAYAAIEAGADLVLGHHPHIAQAVEKYKEGLILYSLGNYTFGTFSPYVDFGLVATVEFSAGKFKQAELTPINVNNFQVQLQPQVLRAESLEKAFNALRELSMRRGTALKLNKSKGVIELDLER